MKRKILIDCDGIALAWEEGFRLFVKHEYGKDLDPAGPCAWDMQEWTGFDATGVKKAITDFNEYAWEFGCLPAVPGAVTGIRKLARQHECEFVVITACSTSSKTVALRKVNLYHIFGEDIKEVHCVDLGESKRTHLADHAPTFWVEDNVGNALLGLEYGHRPLVLKTRHNEKFQEETQDRIQWCESWADIVDVIAAG